MNVLKLTKLVAFVVGLSLNWSSAAGQNVIWAVNAGGEAMIGAHGIAYQKDINDEGLAQHFGENITIGRVVADDAELFRSARFDPTKFGYRIPLIGNGDYLLVLKFAENDEDVQNDGRLIDVVLNKHHQVCNGLDIFKMAGRYNAHFEYVHFKVMGNRLIYKAEVSKFNDGGGVRLDFLKHKGEPFVSAIVLYSGDAEAVKHNLNPALTGHDNAVIKYYATEILHDSYRPEQPILRYSLTRPIQVIEIVRQTCFRNERTDRKLFRFLESLPAAEQLVGYQAAYEEITKNPSYQRGYQTLVLGFFLDELLAKSNVSVKADYEDLLVKMKPAVARAAHQIAVDINGQNYDGVRDFVANYTDGFVHYVRDIVNEAVSMKVDNLKDLLRLINQQNAAVQDLSLFEALLDAYPRPIAEGDDLLLAVFLQQTANKPDFANGPDELRLRLEKLKHRLPSSVQGIVTQYILMKNSYYQEYLFSDWSNIANTSKNLIRVYTLLNKTRPQSLAFNWKLTVPQATTFSGGLCVQNVFSDYLYTAPAGNQSAITGQQPVYLWIFNQYITGEKYLEWTFEPVAGSNKYLVRNKAQNGYLYPADADEVKDGQFRVVYHKLANDCLEEKCFWEIEGY